MQTSSSPNPRKGWLIGTAIITLTLGIFYALTLAQGLVFGDPSEYTYAANVLGIAHPPGYAFITVVGHWFQKIPLGDIVQRMHALSAVSGIIASLSVFGIVRRLGKGLAADVAGVMAGLTVGTAVNFWQHSIHANPHIITATFLAVDLYCLTRWHETRQTHNRWLYVFSLLAGLGVTHHPLTAFSFPAYTIFILMTERRILLQPVKILKMLLFALVGLSVWAYLPWRSPQLIGTQYATDLNQLEPFLNLIFARNLKVNLFNFGLFDQWNRAKVFWTLLSQQYALPIPLLAAVTALWPLYGWAQKYGDRDEGEGMRDEETLALTSDALGEITPNPQPLTPSLQEAFSLPNELIILFILAFVGNYIFVINTIQDVMAYLLGPFLLVGLLAGVGLVQLINLAQSLEWDEGISPAVLLPFLLLGLGPVYQVWQNYPDVSLRDFTAGDDYAAELHDYFGDSGASATLLLSWETYNVMQVSELRDQPWPGPEDIRLRLVAAGENAWASAVMSHLPSGHIFLDTYRWELTQFGVAEGQDGFRIRPRGQFYQVTESTDTSIPVELDLVSATAEAIEVVGYSLPSKAMAGDFVPFVVAMRAGEETADYYAPELRVGDLRMPYTTDHHLITPRWKPNEVIAERFDFALPHDLPSGDYPVELRMNNLSTGEDVGMALSLGNLTVTAQKNPIDTSELLANYRQRIGLVSATAQTSQPISALWDNTAQTDTFVAPWTDDAALVVDKGAVINVMLEWEALAKAEENYTVFIHLIDAGNAPIVDDLDAPPLAGASPPYLWFPKWLPEQRALDPYRLQLPDDIAAGNYFIEVGLYEMVGGRRLLMSDQDGNFVGDRYILGAVNVR